MYILSPSIFAADYMDIGTQLQILEEEDIKRIHVDIMDGSFVPNLSFGSDFVRSLKRHTRLELDVHLMIKDPIRYIEDFADAGADIITVHLEACDDVKQVLDKIHSVKRKAGIVLKPETSLKEIRPEIWSRIQVLQIMTVQPGLRGQSFIQESLQKIRAARNYIGSTGRQIDIEVDGDITLIHLREVLNAGADIVVVGKALFGGSLRDNVRSYLEAGMDLPVYQIG
ncbi:MAG: ribulose-phosphate 3-epimerase [Blautia sp.]|nr:ribulose-phosphate 3-epimerase [Blautia sp.]